MKCVPAIIFILLTLTCYEARAVEIKSVDTGQGVSAWLVEDHTLPIIHIRLSFPRAGSAYDPDDISGTAYMVSQLLKKGAGDYDETGFNEALGDSAISMEFSVDKDNFYAGIRTLAANKEKALGLLELALTKPRLDATSVALAKQQQITFLEKSEEDPHYIATREWEKLYFGSHPYNRSDMGRRESIENITAAQLWDFINRHITRQNLIVSVVGDIHEDEIAPYIGTFLEQLPAAPDSIPPALAEVTPPGNGNTAFVERDQPQTMIIFGQKGIHIKDANFYSFHVMNHILGGGGFESRLMHEIREKNGLAYSVYSYTDFYDKAATLKGYLATRHAEKDRALSLLKEQIKRMHEGDVTEEEVSQAKKYLIGSYPLRMDSYEKLVSYLNFLQTMGLERSFINERNKHVERVTLDDVKHIAKIALTPDKFIFSSVGKKD